MRKSFAVLLAGSGYLDGSEIRESVAALWALESAGASYQCFAPDELQADVINHQQQQADVDQRNILNESARIARSNVKAIQELDMSEYDGIVIPGGYGVAKSLCNFAVKGSSGQIRGDVSKVILACHAQKKGILAVCIAPALLALALKDKAKLELTLGATSEASQEIEVLGHRHVEKAVHEYCFDDSNNIISTPAYMYDKASLVDIFRGVKSAVDVLVAL